MYSIFPLGYLPWVTEYQVEYQESRLLALRKTTQREDNLEASNKRDSKQTLQTLCQILQHYLTVHSSKTNLPLNIYFHCLLCSSWLCVLKYCEQRMKTYVLWLLQSQRRFSFPKFFFLNTRRTLNSFPTLGVSYQRKRKGQWSVRVQILQWNNVFTTQSVIFSRTMVSVSFGWFGWCWVLNLSLSDTWPTVFLLFCAKPIF